MKFKVWEKVWMMYEKKIKHCTIFGIEQRVIRLDKPIDVTYWIGTDTRDRGDWVGYEEDELFVTKQGLIDSL